MAWDDDYGGLRRRQPGGTLHYGIGNSNPRSAGELRRCYEEAVRIWNTWRSEHNRDANVRAREASGVNNKLCEAELTNGTRVGTSRKAEGERNVEHKQGTCGRRSSNNTCPTERKKAECGGGGSQNCENGSQARANG
ncbi:hypothetical protein R1flu_000411 [Riccia fluitans]|uniref:Uncharacterized protein n=1 Tax=Riccia fluitans TaxID=41844 RepID=A0ABD1Y0Q6_9MARC